MCAGARISQHQGRTLQLYTAEERESTYGWIWPHRANPNAEFNLTLGGGGRLEEGNVVYYLRVHACSETLPQLKNEDSDFHAASVQQNAAYNARPDVIARAAEWRNDDGYAGRIASDAVR